MNHADQELVDRLLRADGRAFEEFFNEYYPRLYRFVMRRAPRDIAAAEDIAQGTLCRALESLANYRGEAALFTWLCTLCRREMSLRWRDSHSHGAALAEDDPQVRAALESMFASEDTDPFAVAGREQMSETVRAALDYLPSVYADILEWKYVRDMSVADIAAQLGRSVKATESLLTRARLAFRESFSIFRSVPADGVSSS
jgi:RNA polymerase sigma-70 factor (ECF subfamily)